ncbi:uncharacterized protein METZ01_LOCUS362099 [marine metagenome]|uniref:NIPSNAP domain-containing protein n=1 Tax=marine metagenome TaxID=408172 RepID=A0A382SIE3_9ZZZZ
MKKTSLITAICLSFMVFNSAMAIEIEIWRYKVKPGHMQEAVELFEEALVLAEEAGRNTGIAQQTLGKDGEFIFHWYDIYNSVEERAQPIIDEKYLKYLDKFYASDAISTERSYQMTMIDDQLCNNPEVISVYVWKPKPGMFNETVEEFKASKVFFEKHGWEIDLWQEGMGGRDNLQFVMCSKSYAENANSIASLNADEEWLAGNPLTPLWNSDSENSDLMASFELTPIIID